MTSDRIKKLREHYDNRDDPDAVERGEWHESTDKEIMVSTSIRLPQSLMKNVRAQAEKEGIAATTLMRRWVIEKAEDPTEPLVVPVAELRQWAVEHGYPTPRRPSTEARRADI